MAPPALAFNSAIGTTVAVTTPINALTNVNLLSFIDDTQSRTSTFQQPVTDARYLTSIQAGFEPWNGGVGLTVNSFDATVN
ncbi:MAG: GH12 family glycosyl hydrolase domain-containing protein [Mycobacterium sp.]